MSTTETFRRFVAALELLPESEARLLELATVMQCATVLDMLARHDAARGRP